MKKGCSKRRKWRIVKVEFTNFEGGYKDFYYCIQSRKRLPFFGIFMPYTSCIEFCDTMSHALKRMQQLMAKDL